MRKSCDEALKCFSELVEQEWKGLSESDTRSKIIDPIFTECLNWEEKTDIKREEHSDSGYVDYIFKLRNLNKFVVEAKKEGVSFNIPISYNFRRRYQIGGAISKDPAIKKAIKQAQKYCISHGARFGVVTNGFQFIIFEAMNPGSEWEEGNCVIFYNWDDIKRHFVEFWNILSKDAVEKNSFLEIVARDIEELRFTRPIDGVTIKNRKQPRNNLYRYIRPIIDYAFQEITDLDKLDMLKNCYVYEEEFDEVDKLLRKEFFVKTPTIYQIEEIRKIVQDSKTSGIFQREFYENLKKLGTSGGEPILLLLLGGIGSGKTTFIHRFFNIILPEAENEKKLWFYIDWRKGPTNTKEIRPFILEKIKSEFYEKHSKTLERLKSEFGIDELRADINSVKQIFAILRTLGYILSLVIDNVDQHRSSSETFHENVFIETNSITSELRLITIMTLREESYYRSSITGAFNAYYIQKYVINPPDFIKLILNRLEYVFNKMKLPEEDFKKLLKTNVDFGRRLKAIKDFLQIIKLSFKRPNSRVSDFMAKISGGNMRSALELFSNFLMSGNTKIDEMLSIFRQTGRYNIAHHQLLKSIMMGDYRYYSEDPSYLMNVFDFNVDYSNDHFQNLKILKYAEEHLTNFSSIGRGYVDMNDLNKEAHNILVSPKAVEDSLLRLARRNLIVFDTKSRDNVRDASYFRITECGSYYLNTLIKNFVYLDSVWMDTPIADVDVVYKLRELMNETSLEKRFERTETFLSYLLQMEEKNRKRHPEHSASPLGKYNFAKTMISGLKSEQKRAYKSRAKQYYYG